MLFLRHMLKVAEDYEKNGGIPNLHIFKGSINIKIPKALEVIIDGCMCEKGKGETYVVLDYDCGEKHRGMAETACPHCGREMDFEYYIDFDNEKPKIKFKERRPYNDKNKIVTLISK